MNFDIKKTEILRAVKRARMPLFRFAGFLSQMFLVLFILSLAGLAFSFWAQTSGYGAFKMAVLFFSLWLVFYDFYFFTEFKIKNPQIKISLADAAKDPEKYNIAEFLDFECAKAAEALAKFCRGRKIAVNSTALFYFALKSSKDINLLCFRLGLDIKKLCDDLKNCFEKMQRQENPANTGSLQDFEQTMLFALKAAAERGHSAISGKEILLGLGKHDEFFKKVLVDCDLKLGDIENLTLWLDSAESSLERSRQFWTRENLARKGSLGRDFAAGYTITLDRYAIDWRNIVSRWTFREIIGHKKEIEQVETILAKSSLANALIVGEPGTGRKSIVQALAQKCYLGQSLPELNAKRVVELDMAQLAASIDSFEKLEAVLDQIFSEALAAGNVILAIDELQNFAGQKTQKAGQVDISGIMAKYLAMPSFQFVGITSYEGLHKNIEENSSFADLFRKVEVSETTEAETIRILQGAALEFEHKHKILIIYPAIREIVNLTSRYMPSLPFPKKAIDVLDEAVVYLQAKKEKILLPHHIAEVMSGKTEIPIGKMEVKEKEVLLNLENLIHQRIVNQAEAVKEISIAMRRARAGIANKKRPMGTFLFMGPTGVGKTETAKALAQIYFGGEEKMIRIDMSEFQAISDIPRLIGAQSPVEMQGLLTTPVRETPFSLVLLDEIEKAHPDVLNLLLQVLDEGHITDGQGRKVVFTNTIIICTSNACADMIFKEIEGGGQIKKDQLILALIDKGAFKPEFINRFDATVVFRPLTRENLMQIAELVLQGLKKTLKEKEIDFEITEALKEKIVEMSYKPEFGAREMRRVVQDNVENPIASALLADKLKKADVFSINSETFELVIDKD